MKNEILEIKSNVKISDDVYLLTFCKSDTKYIAGQFIDVKVEGFTLRRPFGVFDVQNGELSILYKVLGEGTKAMSKMEKGTTLDILAPLGNGFDIKKARRPLLVGGGLGAAPLYYLAKQFNEKGIKPITILGAKTINDIVFYDMFKGVSNLYISTDDGSLGFKGNIVEALKHYNFDYDYYYACGSTAMLRFVSDYIKNGELSLEARMACGFGACMGCSIITKNGVKRVCKEGPVFNAEEVIFD